MVCFPPATLHVTDGMSVISNLVCDWYYLCLPFASLHITYLSRACLCNDVLNLFVMVIHHLHCYTSLISIFNTIHNYFVMSPSSATLHFTRSSWVKSSATVHDTDLLDVCHLQCNAKAILILSLANFAANNSLHIYHLQHCVTNSYCLPCGTWYLIVIIYIF